MSYRQEKQGLFFMDKVDPFGMHTVFCGLFRVTKTLFFGRGAAVGFSKCYSIKWKKKKIMLTWHASTYHQEKARTVRLFKEETFFPIVTSQTHHPGNTDFPATICTLYCDVL